MSRIIRADREQSALIPEELFAANLQKAQILERARATERAIIENAERQSEQILSRAREAGREQGRTETAALLIEAARLRDQALAEAKQQIIDISMAAAKRIIARELQSDPDAICNIVAPLLSRARSAHQLIVRVHPSDVEALQKAAPRLCAEAEWQCAIAVEPDPAMDRGGCAIATDAGVFHAGIDIQLAALARILNG